MGIISGRVHGWQMLLGLIEVIAAALLFGLMVIIWQNTSSLVEDAYGQYFFLVVSTLVISSWWTSRNVGILSAAVESHLIGHTLGKALVVALVWLAYLVAFRDQAVSRKFLFTYLVCLPLILLSVRLLAHAILSPLVFGRKNCFGVILLGEPKDDDVFISWLLSRKHMGFQVVGYLAENGIPTTLQVPCLGSREDLVATIKNTRAQLVVSLSLPQSNEQASILREQCDRLGARLSYHCNLGGASSRLSICQSDGVSLLSVRSEPLQNPFNRLIKRSLDLLVSIPVVICLLPWIALLVWFIHRFRSPGPLLFRQSRGGLGGRPFLMLKFRTMHCLGHDETLQAKVGDERVFRGGYWLRKFSLDEFPQFLNVIAGHMSIVGPRPHMEAHDDAFSEVSPEYRVRSLVKPGITGLAQVNGYRGPTPLTSQIDARVKADLHYLENWTLTLDITLLLRTLIQFIKPKNAV